MYSGLSSLSFILLCCLIVFGDWIAAAQTLEEPSTPTIVESNKKTISFNNGLLSVVLVQAKLGDVLKEISNQTGIKMDTGEPLRDEITMQFNDQPLEDGIKKLIKNYNYMLIYNKIHNPKTGKDTFQIHRIMLTNRLERNKQRPAALAQDRTPQTLDTGQEISTQSIAGLSSLIQTHFRQGKTFSEKEIAFLNQAFDQALPEIREQVEAAFSTSAPMAVPNMNHLESLLETIGKDENDQTGIEEKEMEQNGHESELPD